MSESTRKSAGDWYFVHGLAIVSGCLLVSLLCLNFVDLDRLADKTDIPPWIPAPVFLGIVAVFWFWIRMLVDYFRVRPERNSVAWGFFLILTQWLGAYCYFFAIWRKTHRPD